MANIFSTDNALNAMVPLSRFDRGEAGKIVNEVNVSGYKVIINNDAPVCVLLSLDMYNKMKDMLEDECLLTITEERQKNDSGYRISFDELLAKKGLTRAELEDIPMEYGVDFE